MGKFLRKENAVINEDGDCVITFTEPVVTVKDKIYPSAEAFLQDVYDTVLSTLITLVDDAEEAEEWGFGDDVASGLNLFRTEPELKVFRKRAWLGQEPDKLNKPKKARVVVRRGGENSGYKWTPPGAEKLPDMVAVTTYRVTPTEKEKVKGGKGKTAIRGKDKIVGTKVKVKKVIKQSAKVQGTSPVNNTTQKENTFDINAAINYLNANVLERSENKCAAHVKRALIAGGLKFSPHEPEWVTPAKDEGAYLESHGFVRIFEHPLGSDSQFDMANAQKGDIAIFQPFKKRDGTYNSQYGHIEMFNGTVWESDFIAPDNWNTKSFWAGSGYYKAKAAYVIYRWKNANDNL